MEPKLKEGLTDVDRIAMIRAGHKRWQRAENAGRALAGRDAATRYHDDTEAMLEELDGVLA